VEEDDGLGYHDDGEERNFEPDEYADDGGEKDKKRSKKKVLRDADLKGAQTVSSMFRRNGPGSKKFIGPGSSKKASGKRSRPEPSAELDLDSMLEELDGEMDHSHKTQRKNKRPTNRRVSMPASRPARIKEEDTHQNDDNYDDDVMDTGGEMEFEPAEDGPEDGAPEDGAPQDGDDNGEDTGRVSNDQDMEGVAAKEEAPAVPKLSAKERKMRAARLQAKARGIKSTVKAPKVNVATNDGGTRMAPESGPVPTLNTGAANSMWGEDTKEDVQSFGTGDLPLRDGEYTSKSKVAKDGEDPTAPEKCNYLDFFWLDAYEHYDQPGKIYLFGKVKVEDTKANVTSADPKFVSCCVVVNDVQRNLFVLPRETRKRGKTITDEPVSMTDMYEEMKQVLSPLLPKLQGQAFKCKMVERNYAFELPDVPREKTKYLKVVYSAKYKSPDQYTCDKGGSTFKRIFGGSTTAIENFLLKRDLMGPCWLQIRNVKAAAAPVSWCKMEAVTTEGPKSISKLSQPPPAPPLVVASLSLKTVVNPKVNLHEIVMASCVIHKKVSAEKGSEGTNPEHSPHFRQFTAVRPLGESAGGVTPQLPFNFQSELAGLGAQAQKQLAVQSNERGLLNYVLAKLHQEDPDVILGHNIAGFDLDLLLTRMSAHKINSMWSKLGRLKRNKMPKSFAGSGGRESFMGSVCAGRLVCDTYLSARELLRETNYTLTNLASSQLKATRSNVDPMDVPRQFGATKDIVNLAFHTRHDALLSLQLMFKLEILPLTKQLTNLGGNLWARTLKGSRAERIEYLLMHEFHRLKYILPEKPKNKKYGKDNKGGGGGKSDQRAGQSGRKKAAYGGGLVLEPKKGLYDTMVLLLDFNSLYPSIIQEYNICFTTVKRPTIDDGSSAPIQFEGEDDVEEVAVCVEEGESLPELPDPSDDAGVLPRVIRTLVERRKQVKKLLKNESNPTTRQQLDIRQKALKLTANSMYGCLGFSMSRFYAKPIAALVTATGRDTLQRTVDLAQNTLSLDVIYGDTDSIMINTGSTDLEKVKAIGETVKKESNKLYKLLELEIDGIFKSMLLLKKKKYAALVVHEGAPGTEPTYEKELKGLDLVRRDWSPLSKEAGTFVVSQILSGENKEETVSKVHGYLEDLALKMREGKLDLEQFVVTKGLNKAPKDYPDAKGQPHLQVAIRMLSAGKNVNAGDHVPYVICTPDSAADFLELSAAPTLVAARALHPDEYNRSNGVLKLDVEWYMSQQLLPPIARLCEPIDGTSRAIIAEKLGLDSSYFKGPTTNSDDASYDYDFMPKSQLDDEDRFKEVKKLDLKCLACNSTSTFPGVYCKDSQSQGDAAQSGFQLGLYCPDCSAEWWGLKRADGDQESASEDFSSRVMNLLQLKIRDHLKKYYEFWLVCEDSACGYRTQKQSMAGSRCLEHGCRSRMRPEYSDEHLYNQLKYYHTLFDANRALSKTTTKMKKAKASETAIAALPKPGEFHAQGLQLVHSEMEKVMKQSAYNWVHPSLWQTAFGAPSV
jgi:DNA polymerase alpha subunit A